MNFTFLRLTPNVSLRSRTEVSAGTFWSKFVCGGKGLWIPPTFFVV
jgi:hypothetical protein